MVAAKGQRFVQIIDTVAATRYPQCQVVVVHWKDRLIEIPDAIQHVTAKREAGKAIREQKDIGEAAQSAFDRIILQLGLNFMPGAALVKQLPVRPDNSRITTKETDVRIFLEDYYRAG